MKEKNVNLDLTESLSDIPQARNRYSDQMKDFQLENYPDYVHDLPPQSHVLHKISYLDEMERTWGKKWGCQGIGRLREVGLVQTHGY